MNDFLTYLAERKFSLYHYLYFAKPQAYTNEECQNRIEKNIKYSEVMTTISYLPIEQQKVVDKWYDQLKETLL